MNPETENIAEPYIRSSAKVQAYERPNIKSAYKGAVKSYWGSQLKKAQDASARATSPVGIAKQIPSAVKDTTKRMGRGIVNYAKRLNPIPKGGFSPKK